MDTFRLLVLKSLTDALSEIAVAQGYQHDLAGKVFRGRALLTPEDGLPAVTINETPQMPETLEVPESPSAVTKLNLLVQGFVRDDRENPTDPAYLLLGDVQKRLAQEKTTDGGFNILGFGERITSIQIGQGVVRPPDGVVSDTAFFYLPVKLTFTERFNDPFA